VRVFRERANSVLSVPMCTKHGQFIADLRPPGGCDPSGLLTHRPANRPRPVGHDGLNRHRLRVHDPLLLHRPDTARQLLVLYVPVRRTHVFANLRHLHLTTRCGGHELNGYRFLLFQRAHRIRSLHPYAPWLHSATTSRPFLISNRPTYNILRCSI
jgi:hypothetical protein